MRIKFLIAVLLTAAIAAALRGATDEPAITQDELVRRTQEMMDAVVPGNQEPFKKYYADDVLYADEKGRGMDKQALLKDVEPCPRDTPGPSR